MSQITSLLETANPYQALIKETERLVKKWTPSGLLEGRDLNTYSYAKNHMAQLLENQAKQLVVEASQTTSGGTGTGTFTAGTGEQWAGVALPLVRRIFAEIAAKEFVSVQPMNLPAGLVFFLDFKYGNAQPGFASTGSLFGGTGNEFGRTDAAVNGLYGAGRFGYSINETSSAVSNAGLQASSSVTWADLGFDADFSASVANATTQYRKILVPLPSDADLNGVRAFRIASGSATALTTGIEGAQFPQFTTVSSTNTASFIVTASAAFFTAGALGGALSGSATMPIALYYQVQPSDNNRGDFEDRAARPLSGSSAIPEINIEMKSEAIVAKTRKLKAQWTPEFSQDLNAYQSLDAEAELTSILSEYISMEIDLEILDMLIENARTVEYWSAINNQAISYDGTTTTINNSLGFLNTQGGWFQTLGTKLQKVSNKIHQLTLRGGANWMVVSPTVSTVLESIPGFAADSIGDKDQYAMGVQKVGSINSRYKVYKNPYMTENVILMGFRGNQFLETGAVYAPYIPILMTPLVYDPNSFTPRKGLMTRYAKKMINASFFGKIYVSGLNTL